MAKRNTTDFIDIRSILRSWIKHWYLFVISIAAFLAIGIFFVTRHKDKYNVRANILIVDENKSPLSGGLSDLSSMFGAGGSSVDDEIYVLSSHSLYTNVVKELGLNKMHYLRLGILNNDLLYPDWPVEVYASEATLDTLRYSLNFRIAVQKDGKADIKIKGPFSYSEKLKEVQLPHTVKTPYGEFTVDRTASYPKGEDLTVKINITGYHSAAEDIAEFISTEIASKRSNLIEMSYNTPNPALGEALLNEIIQQYNERGINEKNAQAIKTAQFLDERLKLLTADLSDAEADIQRFKEANGLFDVETEVKYQTQKKAGVEAELITAQTNLDVIGLTKDFISDEKNKYELIPIIDGASMATGNAIEKYNELVIRRNELLKNVRPDNQAVMRLTAQIDAMRTNIISTVNQLYDNARVALRQLQAEAGSTGAQLSNVPRQERAVVDLLRQRDIKQELFLFLRQRQEENALMLANAVPKGLIVDEAYTRKKPLGMGKIAMLLSFLMVGCIIPPIYLYLRKVIRNRFQTRDELERITNVPVLGEMCTDNSGKTLVVSPTDTSSTTELFRLMRSNLLFFLNNRDDKVVLVTSSISGEGKSFISINLAASLALMKKKVVLVGMDIRNPSIAKYLNIAPTPGLTQYLASDELSLQQIIHKSPEADIPNLDVIVAGPVPPNPSELLISQKVDTFVKELRQQYDYVLLDSAPVGMISDTYSLNRLADATIYVTKANYTPNDYIDELDEISRLDRLKKLSIVVNGVAAKQSYGYHSKHKA